MSFTELHAAIDFEVLKKELLRAMRGARTQREINDLLEFDFNQCAKWESGEKRVLWTEFIHLADSLGINMRPTFVSPFRYFGEIEDYGSMIVYLSSGRKISQIARDMGASRDKVSRWVNSKQSPTLEDIFMLIRTYYPSMLVNFVDGLVSIKEIPSLYKIYRSVVGLRELLIEKPWTQAVGKCLDLEEYQSLEQHKDGVIARRLGIDIEQERRALKDLTQYGLVRFTKGKYQLVQATIGYIMKYQDSRPLRRFFLNKAIEYVDDYPNQPKGCFMWYDTLLIPKENMRQVIDLAFDFCFKVQRLLDESPYPKRNARMINLTMFRPDPHGEGGPNEDGGI